MKVILRLTSTITGKIVHQKYTVHSPVRKNTRAQAWRSQDSAISPEASLGPKSQGIPADNNVVLLETGLKLSGRDVNVADAWRDRFVMVVTAVRSLIWLPALIRTERSNFTGIPCGCRIHTRVCNRSARTRSTPHDRVDRPHVGLTNDSDRSDRLLWAAEFEPTGGSFGYPIGPLGETGKCVDRRYCTRFPFHLDCP